MRQIATRSQRVKVHRTADVKGLRGTPARRIRFCDLRLLAVAVAAMLAMHAMLNPDPASQRTLLHVGGGQRGVQITSFSLSPATAHVATTNTAGRIALRTPESAWTTERVLEFPGYAIEVAFSPDGRSLAIVDRAGGFWLWELGSPMDKATQVRLDSISWAKHVKYAPDGGTLAITSDRDCTVVIWDLAARRERIVLHQPAPVSRMAFSPGGRILATSGTSDPSILVWDLETGAGRKLAQGERGMVMALTFSPDGAFLASAGFPEHHVCLWDLKTRASCREMAGHPRSVNSVAFSPDGSLMATAGNDGLIAVWSAASGQRLVSLNAEATCLRTVVFSPDGRSLILTTDDDDDIRSWNIAEVLATAATGSKHEHPAHAPLTWDLKHRLASHNAKDLTTCPEGVFGPSTCRLRSGRS
jgi:WD40 repeat protein